MQPTLHSFHQQHHSNTTSSTTNSSATCSRRRQRSNCHASTAYLASKTDCPVTMIQRYHQHSTPCDIPAARALTIQQGCSSPNLKAAEPRPVGKALSRVPTLSTPNTGTQANRASKGRPKTHCKTTLPGTICTTHTRQCTAATPNHSPNVLCFSVTPLCYPLPNPQAVTRVMAFLSHALQVTPTALNSSSSPPALAAHTHTTITIAQATGT